MCVKAYIHMGTETFIYPHKYFIPLHYSILEKSTVKCQGSKILLINSLWILPHLLETLNNTFSLMDGKYGVNWGQGDRGCNNAMLRCSMTGIGPWESPRNRKSFFSFSLCRQIYGWRLGGWCREMKYGCGWIRRRSIKWHDNSIQDDRRESHYRT